MMRILSHLYACTHARARRSITALIGGLTVVAGVGGIVACSDRQRPTAPALPPSLVPSMPGIAITLSDTSPAVGTIVAMTVAANLPSRGPAVGAFRTHITFDDTQLAFVGDSMPNGALVVSRVAPDTVWTAGVSSGDGFADGRLVTLKFRVLDTAGVRSVKVGVDALVDVKFKDRRDEAVGVHIARIQLVPTAPRRDASATPAATYGDAIVNGVVEADDALAILTSAAGAETPVGFDTGAADVTEDGVVTAFDAQVVLAYIVGRVVNYRFGDVVGSLPISVTGIAPAIMRPGDTVTITGVNFSGVTTKDTVRLDTVMLAITASSPTQIKGVVPASMPCFPLSKLNISIRSNGASTKTTGMFRTGEPLSFTPGEWRLLSDSASLRCNELSAGRYVAAVFEGSRMWILGEVGFTFGRLNGFSTSPSPPKVPVMTRVQPPRLLTLGDELTMRRRTRAHLKLMERERTIVARSAGAVARNTRARSGAVRFSVLPAVPVVGGYVSVRVIDPVNIDTFFVVRARVAYIGAKAIALEDSLAPLATKMDGYYKKIVDEFSTTMFPILQENFGNPLAMDANLDGDGRIIMLFTPLVNTKFDGASAFVTSCDMVLPSACPASNLAEIFYAEVPMGSLQDDPYNSNTPLGWYNYMIGTVIHEAKHITSGVEKFSRSTSPVLEDSWLEEGTAQVASEIYARQKYGLAWKGNSTYSNSVYREIFLSPGTAFTLYSPFSWLYSYEYDGPSSSPIAPGWYDANIYGSGWMLARWAADQTAANEGTFFRSLVQQATQRGVDNLEARAGIPWETLLGRWHLSLALDDIYTLNPQLSIPSWNVPSVFSGFYQHLDGIPTPSPLRRYSFSTTGSERQSVAAGAAFFADVDVASQNTAAIWLRAYDGVHEVSSGSTLRIAIARVQ